MIAKKSVLIILLIGVLLNTNLLFFTQVITGFFTLEDGGSEISLIDDDTETNITFNNITTTCFILKDGRKLCKVGTVKVSSGDVEDIDVVIGEVGVLKLFFVYKKYLFLR